MIYREINSGEILQNFNFLPPLFHEPQVSLLGLMGSVRHGDNQWILQKSVKRQYHIPRRCGDTYFGRDKVDFVIILFRIA